MPSSPPLVAGVILLGLLSFTVFPLVQDLHTVVLSYFLLTCKSKRLAVLAIQSTLPCRCTGGSRSREGHQAVCATSVVCGARWISFHCKRIGQRGPDRVDHRFCTRCDRYDQKRAGAGAAITADEAFRRYGNGKNPCCH